MADETTTTEIAIERGLQPDELALLFIDGGSRELYLGLSNIEPGSDTSDAALLRLAANLIDNYGSVESFIDASIAESG